MTSPISLNNSSSRPSHPSSRRFDPCVVAMTGSPIEAPGSRSCSGQRRRRTESSRLISGSFGGSITGKRRRAKSLWKAKRTLLCTRGVLPRRIKSTRLDDLPRLQHAIGPVSWMTLQVELSAVRLLYNQKQVSLMHLDAESFTANHPEMYKIES